MVNRIKESNITDGAVTSDKIAPGTINADRLAGSIGNDKLTNSSITINGTSISLGASGDISAGTDWQSVITADGSTTTTAVAGEGYFIDTTSAAHTINLPASPTQGDEVTIVDYAATFGTNNVTVGRNGSNIDSSAVDATLATNRLNVRFVYIDSTQGWRAIFDDASTNYGTLYVTATGGTITTSGDYKIHVFTGDGCFVVSCAGNPNGSASVDYLVVAGGAGGGGTDSGGGGGGGGAGGLRFSASTYSTPTAGNGSALPVSATTYPVTVGAGGTGGTTSRGTAGSNSIFSTITSTGGGTGGRGQSGCGTLDDGVPGGSGGGGGTRVTCGSEFPPGGSGNTPPVSPSQGNNGGNGGHVSGSFQAGGGGGGAGAAGTDVSGSPSPSSPSGIGGAGKGLPASIAVGGAGESGPGCLQYFSGGGGGGMDKPTGNAAITPNPAPGGVGGGGSGSPDNSTATAGSSNTGGGGGGGGGPTNGAAGGKGIVIIRYKYQN